jgi:hypothetical protein
MRVAPGLQWFVYDCLGLDNRVNYPGRWSGEVGHRGPTGELHQSEVWVYNLDPVC